MAFPALVKNAMRPLLWREGVGPGILNPTHNSAAHAHLPLRARLPQATRYVSCEPLKALALYQNLWVKNGPLPRMFHAPARRPINTVASARCRDAPGLLQPRKLSGFAPGGGKPRKLSGLGALTARLYRAEAAVLIVQQPFHQATSRTGSRFRSSSSPRIRRRCQANDLLGGRDRRRRRSPLASSNSRKSSPAWISRRSRTCRGMTICPLLEIVVVTR